MASGLSRLSVSEFQRRRLRSLLTMASIALGVAAIVAVSVSIDLTRESQLRLARSLSGNADLIVRAKGGRVFLLEDAKGLAQDPSIESLSPVLRRFTVLLLPKDQKARIQLMGVDPDDTMIAQDYRIVAGRWIQDARDLVLDESLASSLSISVGATVRFLTQSGIQEGTVVGLMSPSTTTAVSQGSVAVTTLATAQHWFRNRDRVDSLQVMLRPPKQLDTTQERLIHLLPDHLTVTRPELGSRSADESLLATQSGLRLAAMFSLIIASFIIFNAFQMSVGERRRQIGILRAIGTTRRQVLVWILREAIVLWLFGTVIGWFLGYFGAQGLVWMTQQLLAIEMAPMAIGIWPIVLSTLAGLFITLLGAIGPAMQGSGLPPQEAMRVVSTHDFEPLRTHWVFVGLASMASGLGLLLWCVFGNLHVDYTTYGAVLLLGGWLLVLPGILAIGAESIHRWMPRRYQVPSRLAMRQLLRHRYRSAVTVGVLFLSLTFGMGLAMLMLDHITDVERWYRRSIVGDFFIRAAMPDLATGQAADIPEDVESQLKSIPGILSLEGMRFVNARSGDATIVVVARDFHQVEQVYFDLQDGSASDVLERLRTGGIVIGSVLAERMQWRMADRVPITTLHGEETVQIVGITNDYLGGGLTMYMTRELAKEFFDATGSDVFIIKADDAKIEAVEKRLASYCVERGLMFQSYKDLIQYIHRIMNGVLGSLWVLMFLASLIAGFGLINTLTMSILEQTREIGLLRAVAMTRGQVRQLIAMQAIQMGILALVPAAPMGVLLAWLINLSSQSFTGHAIQFHLRPQLCALALATEMGLIFLVTFIPAERAARLSIAKALQYE